MTTEDRVGNSHGDDGRFVSLREYLESKIDLKWSAHESAHENADRELVENRAVIQARLIELNNLRREYIADRSQYVLREVFERELEPLQAFHSKALGFGALASLVSGVVGAVIEKALTK